MEIHASAIVSDQAVIGEGSIVGPGAVIEDGVVVGQGCKLAAYSVLRKGTVLGDEVTVDSFAVVGGDPQALSFDSSLASGVKVGNGVTIREGCTISRATQEGADTVIGDGCYLMAQAHVAHDCFIGKDVVLCNNVMVAGHVDIRDKAFVGGGAGIHQFCRIGAYAMIAGNASIAADVPPYVMAAERNAAHGLNMVGLKRAGFARPEIADLKRCYRAVFFGGGNLKKKAAEAVREHEFGTTAVGARFLSFFESGKRGFVQSSTDLD